MACFHVGLRLKGGGFQSPHSPRQALALLSLPLALLSPIEFADRLVAPPTARLVRASRTFKPTRPDLICRLAPLLIVHTFTLFRCRVSFYTLHVTRALDALTLSRQLYAPAAATMRQNISNAIFQERCPSTFTVHVFSASPTTSRFGLAESSFGRK
eukprot:GHVT01027810.1.p3 GENE.GHVT01027810.1~~GHVT01027810.1.p3  ORF type:complete len:156 (-),score=9.61 GHVT01027810.1:1285-1752(-)